MKSGVVKRVAVMGIIVGVVGVASCISAYAVQDGGTDDSICLITQDWLRVRSYPSLDGYVLDVANPNTVVDVVELRDDGWAEVCYDGQTAYMYAEYLGNYFVDGFDMVSSGGTDDTVDTVDTVDDGGTFDVSEGGTSVANTEEGYTYYQPQYYTAEDLYLYGIVEYGEYRYTWYSERVLPGGGLDIPNRHIDADGFVVDGDDYICLASDRYEKGTVVYTPFGKDGKVYDCGPGADDILDVYVNW